MSLLRPETMCRGTLVIQADRARAVVDAIGSRSCVQFEDMNALELLRPYRKHLQRLDELERVIRSLREDTLWLPDMDPSDVVCGNVDGFLAHVEDYSLNEVEAEAARLRKDFSRLRESADTVLKARSAAIEAQCIAQLAETFAKAGRRPSIEGGKPSLTRTGSQEGQSFSRQVSEEGEDVSQVLSTIAGLIQQQEQHRFERAIIRATYGNVFVHSEPLGDVFSDLKTERRAFKSSFVIIFQNRRQGRKESALAEKVKKVCSAFGACIYPWYSSLGEASAACVRLAKQVEEQTALLKNLQGFIRQEAGTLCRVPYDGGNSLIEEWRMFCDKEKAVYTVLNGFESGGVNVRADCWYPAIEEENIKALLSELSMGNPGSFQGSVMIPDRNQTHSGAPTYIRTNALTEASQLMVDTYGVPRYREANPALFTVVTFPFLFGVMFGDVGHGLLLLGVGLLLTTQEDSLRRSAPALYSSRYLVIMMGFFATYCGLLYNDFFSLGLPLFASRWKAPEGAEGQVMCEAQFDTRNEGGAGPYPFGVDWAWNGARNQLTFMNSLKMKLSVLIGVVHMLAGLALRCFNALCEGSLVDLIFECAPMALFMLSFFGFMDVMILYKWVTPMESSPSIINSMICMAMPGTVDPAPMFGPELPGRLMLYSLAAVPWLLFPKPLLLWLRARKLGTTLRGPGPNPRQAPRLSPPQIQLAERGLSLLAGGPAPRDEEEGSFTELISHREEGTEEEFDFSEVMMHQTIETIEYVLGTVSHVASYLRLWALSLAHGQLSEVFFRYTIGVALAVGFPGNVLALFLLFPMWAAVTTAVLLGMDVLECGLHTLRLHWVEFQSKFYRADGRPFEPLSFRSCLAAS